MTDELKPCPFCGGNNLKSGGDDKTVGTWCLDCQATGPNHYGEHEWNTRAPVRVKKLVWEGDGHWHSGDNEGWLEEAETPFGTYYTIEFADSLGAGWKLSYIDGGSDAFPDFETPGSARRAAQADFERRVKECLE